MKWVKIIILSGLLVLVGCRNTKLPDRAKLEKIEGLYKIIYDLYQKLGYEEIDSINNVFDTLNVQMAYYIDSLGNGENAAYYRTLKDIHSELDNYLQANNSFNEEVYTLEDNISRLEYYVRSGKMSDSLFYERFKTEQQDLNDIADRIYEKRKVVMSNISSYYRIKPELDKIINTTSSK